ncbi:MAG: hypothetical protein CM15mV47_730 [uncultured marine virus]|nr:MAG: hypothetical protein CM15mV47_730 [uncultured marine virus]
MAFNRAAGYNNPPSGTLHRKFLAKKSLNSFSPRASVAEDITNTDYAGEIENYGDKPFASSRNPTRFLHMLAVLWLTQKTWFYDQTTMVVDRKAFAFKIDDIEERQSQLTLKHWQLHQGPEAGSTTPTSCKFSDGQVLLVPTTLLFSGGLTTTELIWDRCRPVTLSGATAGGAAVNLMLLMARSMDDQSVPEENPLVRSTTKVLRSSV